MVIYVMFYSYVTVYQREIYIFAGNPSMFPPISCVMFEAGDHAIYIPRRKSQEKIPWNQHEKSSRKTNMKF
jgi:hypothetical protein